MKNLVSRLLIAALIITTVSACGTSGYLSSGDEYYDNDQGYHDNNYSRYQNSAVSYDMFYNHLSPYGNWVNYPGYGRVWIVNEPGFRPYYSNGRWVYTNHGWTWASNYDWGWAPFHYGRWGHDPRYGWFWVPGLEWAPAWVSWRGGGSHYGWAPLAPRNWNRNHYDPWVFVNSQHINQPNISQYFVQQHQNHELLNRTQVMRPVRKGTDFSAGPGKAEVEHVLRQPIQPVKVVNAEKADRDALLGNEIKIFRPQPATQPAGNPAVLRPNLDDQIRTQESGIRREETFRRDERPNPTFGQAQPNADYNQRPIRQRRSTPQPGIRHEERVQPQRPVERTPQQRPVMQQRQPASPSREFRPVQPSAAPAPSQMQQQVERPQRTQAAELGVQKD